MIRLITNETCLVMKNVHIRQVPCTNHDVIILSMKNLRGSFNHGKTKHAQMVDGCGEEATAQIVQGRVTVISSSTLQLKCKKIDTCTKKQLVM